jgi:hypothetical protein
MTDPAYDPQSPIVTPLRPAEALAGLAAAAAIFLGFMTLLNLHLTINGVNLDFRPIRVGVPAVGLAILAAWIGGRHARLAAFAVFFAGACWMASMAIAVVYTKPLF